MGLLILICMIGCSNFSAILLIKREGIKSLSSWKTAVICVLVVPLVAFAILNAAIYLMMVYD